MRPRDTSYDGLLVEHCADLPRHGALLGVAGGVILRAEHVGPAFIDYLAAGWDDLIA